MAKKERLNEEAAMNNNLSSSVLRRNDEIEKLNKEPLLRNPNSNRSKK